MCTSVSNLFFHAETTNTQFPFVYHIVGFDGKDKKKYNICVLHIQ